MASVMQWVMVSRHTTWARLTTWHDSLSYRTIYATYQP